MLLVARSALQLCECNPLQNVHVKYGMIETYQTIRAKHTENCLSTHWHLLANEIRHATRQPP